MKSREELIAETVEIVKGLSMLRLLKVSWCAKALAGVEQEEKAENKAKQKRVKEETDLPREKGDPPVFAVTDADGLVTIWSKTVYICAGGNIFFNPKHAQEIIDGKHLNFPHGEHLRKAVATGQYKEISFLTGEGAPGQ